MGILAAVVYGLIHDQITIRLSREYFTVEHPLIFGELDDTRLALCWGVAATWWMGMIGGTIIGLAAVLGSAPALCPRRALRAMILAILVTGCCAGVVGTLSWMDYQGKKRQFTSHDEDIDARAVVALNIHSTSYLVGGLGFLAVAAWSSRVRRTSKSGG